MRLDFSSVSLKNRAFSEQPMAFVDREAKTLLSGVLDLAAIETGNRAAREFWQQKQLQNVLTHAAQKSPFWRRRVGTEKIRGVGLSDLPIQTREDVVAQVTSEGALVRPNEASGTVKHSTSGSSGTPVEFFVAGRNSIYNMVRSVTQYFLEDLDLSLNRTRLRPERMKPGFTIKKSDSWIKPAQSFLRTGINKHVTYFHPDMKALCEEFERDKLGYFIAQPRFVEMVLQHAGAAFFAHAGAALLMPIAEALDPATRGALEAAGVPVRANYTSEEFGPIAFECDRCPGSYHVATSNVIVEVVLKNATSVGGKRAGQVLVTGLHSYATPFIRYDIGDIACLDERCACGHDGPALSNIFGRSKALLKHADGTTSVFFPRASELLAVARFKEFRLRQVAFDLIVAEIGGRVSLSETEQQGLEDVIKAHAGSGFKVEIAPVAEIDWGMSAKQLGFTCEV